MGNSMGRGCSPRCSRRAGPTRVVRPRAPWRRGRGATFRLDALGACLKPGRLIELKEGHFTREAYGPILLLCCWALLRVGGGLHLHLKQRFEGAIDPGK